MGRRGRSTWSLLGLVVWLAACSGDSEPEASVPPLTRLWETAPPVTTTSSPGSARGVETRLESTFDGQDGLSWLRVVPAAAEADGYVMQPFAPADGALSLGTDEARAAITRLPVRSGEALRLSVTARASGASGAHEMPIAAMVELPRELDPTQPLRAQDIANLFDPDRHATHTLFATLSGEAVEARIDFVVERNTTELVVYLFAPVQAPPEAVIVEHVTIEKLPLVDHVGSGGAFPGMSWVPSSAAVSIALDRDVRLALPALPDGARSWGLPASTEARRLELSLGVAPRAPGLEGAITLRVDWDGQSVLEERLTAPTDPQQPAWHDRILTLPPNPDGEATLVFTAVGEGNDPPLAFWGHPTVMERNPDRPPNIVLISLDTLRPDRLGAYGGDGSISPRLDALAAEGLLFRQAYSTSSYTLPSHASMLTGTYPAFHGAVNIDDALDAKRSPFLARILADAGYQTAGFTGGGYVSASYGFGEGFDRYSHNDPVWALDAVRGQQLLRTRSWERVPAQVAFLTRYASPSIVDWIEQREQSTPFFAFLHTYIVHNYAPDQEWLTRRGLKGDDGSEQPFNHQDRTRFNEGESDLQDSVYDQYMPYYDATIGMADDFVGDVLDALDRAGLAGNTIVIVTSDHGEEFGEHGFFGHGETLYEGNTRIPLIARLPAGLGAARQPAVVDEPVSLVDLAPWILGLVGLESDKRMATVAPLGPTRLDPPGRESLFMELDTHTGSVRRLSALREGDWTLHRLLEGEVHGIEPEGRRLFEVSGDPGETVDRAEDEMDLADRMSAIIDRFHELAEAVNPRDDAEPPNLLEMDPEQLDMLIQLGYIDADDVRRAREGDGN